MQTNNGYKYSNYNNIFNITLAIYGTSSLITGIVYATIRLIPDIHRFGNVTWKDSDKYYLIALGLLTSIVLISAIINRLLNNKIINKIKKNNFNKNNNNKIIEKNKKNKKEKEETFKIIAIMALTLIIAIIIVAIIVFILLAIFSAAGKGGDVACPGNNGCGLDIFLFGFLLNNHSSSIQQTTIITSNGDVLIIEKRPYIETRNIAKIFIGIAITSMIVIIITTIVIGYKESHNAIRICEDILICLGVMTGIVMLSSLFMLLANALTFPIEEHLALPVLRKRSVHHEGVPTIIETSSPFISSQPMQNIDNKSDNFLSGSPHSCNPPSYDHPSHDPPSYEDVVSESQGAIR